MPAISVRHNIEMGHRLALQPNSKCFHLHGHSWWVELYIKGEVDHNFMIMEFSEVKYWWRKQLDTVLDHHLLLNSADPLVKLLSEEERKAWGIVLTEHDGYDPTVEYVAMMLHHWATELFGKKDPFEFHIKLWEASTNMAEYGYMTGDVDAQAV